MPILRIIKRQMAPGVYDAAAAELDLDTNHPLGLIMHGATQTGETMEIAQVWESEEYAQRYDEEHLRPALEAVGAPLDAQIAVFELQPPRHALTSHVYSGTGTRTPISCSRGTRVANYTIPDRALAPVAGVETQATG